MLRDHHHSAFYHQWEKASFLIKNKTSCKPKLKSSPTQLMATPACRTNLSNGWARSALWWVFLSPPDIQAEAKPINHIPTVVPHPPTAPRPTAASLTQSPASPTRSQPHHTELFGPHSFIWHPHVKVPDDPSTAALSPSRRGCQALDGWASLSLVGRIIAPQDTRP